MSRLLKAMPFLLLFAALSYGQGTTFDCSFVFTGTATGVQLQADSATSRPCRTFAATYTSTGFSTITVSFGTSPDSNTGNYVAIPNTACSSTAPPVAPCVLTGASPITAGKSGEGSYLAYAPFVGINVSSVTGSGTYTITVYGYKGLSANAAGGGTGSGGGNLTIAGTTNQLNATGAGCTPTNTGTCTVALPNASVTIDPTTGNIGTPGNYQAGVGSGKTGAFYAAGATDALAQGFSVNDTAGVSILYLLPSSAGAAGQALKDNGAVTCPTLAAGAPAVCHQLVWATLNYQTVDANGTPATQRPTVNFISGTNATVTCVDNAGSTRTDCTVAATAGSAAPTFPVNAQTATYQLLAADFSNCKTIAVASGTFTITGVASGSQPASGACVFIINYGSGVVTFARSGQNINGAAANLTIAAGSASAPNGLLVVSDATNYIAQTLGGSGGGGGGTPGGSSGQLQYNNGGAFGGTGSFIMPNLSTTGATVTSLPTSGWTIRNAAVLNDFSIGLTAVHVTANGSTNLRTVTQPVTVPYTLIIVLECRPNNATGNSQLCGPYVTDGTKYEGFAELTQSGADPVLRVETWTNSTTFGSAVSTSAANVAGRLFAIKIVNNSTNRIFSYWSNGAWVQQLSETSGTFLTETAIGFGGANITGAGNLLEAHLLYWSLL